MKTSFTHRAVMLAAVVVGSGSSGCGPDPLIGSWQGSLSSASTVRFDLRADGTMTTVISVRSTEAPLANCVTTQTFTGGTWTRRGAQLQFSAMTSCASERAMCSEAAQNSASMACTRNAFMSATASTFTLSGDTLTLSGDPPTTLSRL
ncbi:MAG: hypothetical protein JNK05_07580 [Myxococcales bacterium]|nr:hypothetical protein [Myxococcales bacterium]